MATTDYDRIYAERLEREHDRGVASAARKIPGFIEDCMREAVRQAYSVKNGKEDEG